MKDDESAKVELASAWSDIPGDVRRICADAAQVGDVPSSLELLTDAQMLQWSRNGSRSPASINVRPGKP